MGDFVHHPLWIFAQLKGLTQYSGEEVRNHLCSLQIMIGRIRYMHKTPSCIADFLMTAVVSLMFLLR